MTLDLSDLTSSGYPWLFGAAVIFLRVGAMMAVLPGLGERSVPARVRLGLAIALTVLVTPLIAPDLPEPEEVSNLVGLLLIEASIGLLLGMSLRLFVFTLSTAGAIAAQSTSLSQIFGGSAGAEAQPAIGHVLVTGGLTIAMITELHLRVVEFIVMSYGSFPTGVPLSATFVADFGVSRVAASFAFAFTLAAPFFIASLIYNVTLGVINRAMPQLMVSFVGAPVITAGGLVLLALSAPTLLGLWIDAFHDFMGAPSRGPNG
ncbi:flagellar biosynthetic protein FliR [Thalassobium sp. R2A62]|nr:flagellar biosynthetic protein FliR [Thalassobium sp. R2A62]